MKSRSLAPVLALMLMLGLIPRLTTHALAEGETTPTTVETQVEESTAPETTAPVETTVPEETTISTEATTLPTEPQETDPQKTTVPTEYAAEDGCTCGGESDTHLEGCPLYQDLPAPASLTHTAPCADDCADEACLCFCHLFPRLMAAEDPEVFFSLLETMTDSQYQALTAQQTAMLEAKADALAPQPGPALVLTVSEQAVESEIYVPTANYAQVAPFGEPVRGTKEGGHK